jgi:hypothetical protein
MGDSSAVGPIYLNPSFAGCSARAPIAPPETQASSKIQRMSSRVETFEKDPDTPAQISPELVLVSPPEVARAAREALEQSSARDRLEALAMPNGVPAQAAPGPPKALPSVPSLTRPTSPPGRLSRSRLVLAAAALVLVAGGFFAGRELKRQHGAPAASPAVSDAAQTVRAPGSATSPAGAKKRPAAPATLPLVTWKAKPGVRRYRFDLLSGRVAILTIVTNEPRARIPLTWPNAGRRRHLAPGRYGWTVRPASNGPAGLIARGTITIRKPRRS